MEALLCLYDMKPSVHQDKLNFLSDSFPLISQVSKLRGRPSQLTDSSYSNSPQMSCKGRCYFCDQKFSHAVPWPR